MTGNKLLRIIDKTFCYEEDKDFPQYFKKGTKRKRPYSSRQVRVFLKNQFKKIIKSLESYDNC